MTKRRKVLSVVKVALFSRHSPALSPRDFRTAYEQIFQAGGSWPQNELKEIVRSGTRNYVIESQLPFRWRPDFDVVTTMMIDDSVDFGPDRQAAAFTGLVQQYPDVVDAAYQRWVVLDEHRSEMPPSSAPVLSKALFFVARRDTFNVEQFKQRYELGHAVLARKILAPHLLQYQRNYVIGSGPAAWQPDFDVITEFFYDNTQLELSEEELKYLTRDEEVFFDRSSMRYLLVEESNSSAS